MNVINIEDLEREILSQAARVYPPADRWLMSVAKERLLNLDAAGLDENFVVYDPPPEVKLDPNLPSPSKPVMNWWSVVQLLRGVEIGHWDSELECKTNLPRLPALPDLAQAAQARGEKLYLFDGVQMTRRRVWQQIKAITVWLNSLPAGEREVSNLSKLTFEDAFTRAAEFAKKVGFKFD